MPILGICRVCGANTTGGVLCADCLRPSVRMAETSCELCNAPARAAIGCTDGRMPLCTEHLLAAIDRGRTVVVFPLGSPLTGLEKVREAVRRDRGDRAVPTRPILWAEAALT